MRWQRNSASTYVSKQQRARALCFRCHTLPAGAGGNVVFRPTSIDRHVARKEWEPEMYVTDMVWVPKAGLGLHEAVTRGRRGEKGGGSPLEL